MEILLVTTKKQVFTLVFKPGQNSLGEPDLFCHSTLKEFKHIYGWPAYAATQWIHNRGWHYEW